MSSRPDISSSDAEPGWLAGASADTEPVTSVELEFEPSGALDPEASLNTDALELSGADAALSEAVDVELSNPDDEISAAAKLELSDADTCEISEAEELARSGVDTSETAKAAELSDATGDDAGISDEEANDAVTSVSIDPVTDGGASSTLWPGTAMITDWVTSVTMAATA